MSVFRVYSQLYCELKTHFQVHTLVRPSHWGYTSSVGMPISDEYLCITDTSLCYVRLQKLSVELSMVDWRWPCIDGKGEYVIGA